MLEVKTIRKERKITAREAAKRLNVTPRTIVNYQALERSEYLERAALRRQKAWDMRSLGCSWDEIANALDTTYGGARSLYYQHIKRLKAEEAKAKTRDTDTLDMFE